MVIGTSLEDARQLTNRYKALRQDTEVRRRGLGYESRQENGAEQGDSRI